MTQKNPVPVDLSRIFPTVFLGGRSGETQKTNPQKKPKKLQTKSKEKANNKTPPQNQIKSNQTKLCHYLILITRCLTLFSSFW